MQHLASRRTFVPQTNEGNFTYRRSLDFDIPGSTYWWTVELVTVTWQWWTESVDPSDPLPTFGISVVHNENEVLPQKLTLIESTPGQQSLTQEFQNGLSVGTRDTVRIPWRIEMPFNANLYQWRVDLIQAALYGTLNRNYPER